MASVDSRHMASIMPRPGSDDNRIPGASARRSPGPLPGSVCDHEESSRSISELFDYLLSARGRLVRVDAATCGTAATTVRARCRDREGFCPSCGTASVRVHDRYRRRMQIVPLAARRVRIELEVHRFVCANRQCAQKTFPEQ